VCDINTFNVLFCVHNFASRQVPGNYEARSGFKIYSLYNMLNDKKVLMRVHLLQFALVVKGEEHFKM
jgi:hypothetical protein